MGMKYRKCELCGVDEAMADGLLCPSCREAIARVMAIESPQDEQNEAAGAVIEIVDQPEATQNTRKAGS